jgi:hypothetical protein
MLKLIFMFLCGCLYLIGLPFGLSYKETSIYICIYACPIICIISALLSLRYSTIKTFLGRCRVSLNISLLIFYIGITNMFWKHYGEVKDPFARCMNDLIDIARSLHISYEECNLQVYCVLFFSIVFFHIVQLFLFKPKKHK